jgi:hypothetical protein
MTIFDLWIRRINYLPQRLRDIEKKALEMGVKISQAVGARRNFLHKELALFKHAPVDHLTRAIICWPMQRMIEKELNQLRKDLLFREHPPKGQITPEMIERASQFPIHELIEFDSRGMALCFNHEEKTGSLHLNKKTNTCHCFGQCGETWNPLHVLKLRDNLSFPDAVRKLCVK